MPFKDHFSQTSSAYAKYRPSYPKELFQYLNDISKSHQRAWDCGTGNGQAAVELANFFEEVIATDASASQIEQAIQHPKATYLVEPAEQTTLENNSVDLVTVSQAAHWFDLEKFYQEVKRVLKPEGILALWTYPLHQISPEIDPIMEWYYGEVLGTYWPPERRLVEERYRTIPFPFEELTSPSFEVKREWNLDELLGYLSTWSGTQRYRNETGKDPLELLKPRLEKTWGEPESKRSIQWELILRVGKKNS